MLTLCGNNFTAFAQFYCSYNGVCMGEHYLEVFALQVDSSIVA